MANRVAVIGGGIAGLAAAYTLVTEGPGAEITLVEARPRLGGVILTERHDDFLIDGGPDSFLARKPGALELCEELGLSDELLPAAEMRNKVRILREGKMELLPDGFLLGIPPDARSLLESTLLTMRGKMRMAMEPFVARREEETEESVADFWRRRLGDEAYERIGEPLLGGIHASDTERLSLHATFPDIAAMERKHGSLTRALRKRPKGVAPGGGNPGDGNPGGAAKRPQGFVSLKGGMGDLVAVLEETIRGGAEVHLGERIAVVEGHETPYRIVFEGGDAIEVDALVMAAPAHAAAAVFRESHPALGEALARIPYVSSSVVYLAYPRSAFDRMPGGYGFLIPRTEKRRIIAATFVSSKFAGRAPDDVLLVRAFVGGALNEELASLSEPNLIRLAIEELAEVLGIEARPSWVKTYFWEKAMAQYNVGHLARVEAIDHEVAGLPGLILAGAGYRGSGIPDCIRSGRAAAREALSLLAS